CGSVSSPARHPAPTRRSSDLPGWPGAAGCRVSADPQLGGVGIRGGPVGPAVGTRRSCCGWRGVSRYPGPEAFKARPFLRARETRSEEHTSELQSREIIVCRLL